MLQVTSSAVVVFILITSAVDVNSKLLIFKKFFYLRKNLMHLHLERQEQVSGKYKFQTNFQKDRKNISALNLES